MQPQTHPGSRSILASLGRAALVAAAGLLFAPWLAGAGAAAQTTSTLAAETGNNSSASSFPQHDNGNVVAVWERFDEGRYKLRCRVGKLSTDLSLINWGDWLELAPYEGVQPCVALTNDGFVVAVYNTALSAADVLRHYAMR